MRKFEEFGGYVEKGKVEKNATSPVGGIRQEEAIKAIESIKATVSENSESDYEKRREEEREATEREFLIRNQKMLDVFYDRFEANGRDDELCSRDEKMLKVMKYFQAELFELSRKILIGKNDSFELYAPLFDCTLGQASMLFGRHGEIVKDDRLKHKISSTLFRALLLIENKSHDFKFILSRIIDYKGSEHVRDRLKFMSEDEEKVLNKITELIGLAQKTSVELKNIIYDDKKSELPRGIRRELLDKADKIISGFSGEIGSTTEIDREKLQKLLSDLEKSKTEMLFLSSYLLSMKKDGRDIDWEAIRDFEFDIKEYGTDIGPEAKEEIVAMAERNWEQNPALRNTVVGGLKKSLEDGSKQKYYIFKYQGKMVAFVRFEPTGHNTLIVGSFNVDPDARGSGIGEEMMERAFGTEAEKNILEATASPRIPAGTAYVEKCGFVIDGFIADYHKTGEPLFSIRLDRKQNESYAYRSEGKQNAISEEDIKQQCVSNENIDSLIGQDPIVLRFDMQAEFEKLKSVMGKLLFQKDDAGKNIGENDQTDKYIITRYFQDKTIKERDERYFMLEKI